MQVLFYDCMIAARSTRSGSATSNCKSRRNTTNRKNTDEAEAVLPITYNVQKDETHLSTMWYFCTILCVLLFCFV